MNRVLGELKPAYSELKDATISDCFTCVFCTLTLLPPPISKVNLPMVNCILAKFNVLKWRILRGYFFL